MIMDVAVIVSLFFTAVGGWLLWIEFDRSAKDLQAFESGHRYLSDEIHALSRRVWTIEKNLARTGALLGTCTATSQYRSRENSNGDIVLAETMD